MKILSPFKDYYDHVMKVYGPEEGVVYDRKPLEQEVYTIRDVDKFIVPPNIDQMGYATFLLVIAGKVFPFVKKMYDYEKQRHLLNSPLEHLVQEHYQSYRQKYLRLFYNERAFENLTEKYKKGYPKFVELCKLVHHPVFMITRIEHIQKGDGLKKVKVDKNIPTLSELGIPKLIPAEQMYQDINHFLTNVLRENPDTNPPIQIEQKYRFEEKGFDNKTSFRGRL